MRGVLFQPADHRVGPGLEASEDLRVQWYLRLHLFAKSMVDFPEDRGAEAYRSPAWA
jgi:hypothetical protein